MRWAQRQGAEEGYTGLRPRTGGDEQTIRTRLACVAGRMLGRVSGQGGAPYQVQKGCALEPITEAQIQEFAASQGKGAPIGDIWAGASRTGTLARHLAGCLGGHDGELGRTIGWVISGR